MNKRITVLSGDYIGPEIVEQGILALEAVARRFGHRFEFCKMCIRDRFCTEVSWLPK